MREFLATVFRAPGAKLIIFSSAVWPGSPLVVGIEEDIVAQTRLSPVSSLAYTRQENNIFTDAEPGVAHINGYRILTSC